MSARPTTRSDLGMRALVALPLLGVLAAILIAGGLAFLLAVIVAALICQSELYRMMPLLPFPQLRVASAVVIIGVFPLLWLDSQDWWLAALIAPFVVILIVAAGLSHSWRHFFTGMAKTLLGIYWIGLCLAHAILLRDLPHGDWLLAFVLASVIANDTVAYLGGKKFGRRKFARHISPKKTLAGLVCGIVAGVFTVLIIGYSQPRINFGQAFSLGVGVAITAPCGDLFESWIKRRYDAKDSSHLLGPHGGLLDRIDAVMFAVVAGYWICQAYSL